MAKTFRPRTGSSATAKPGDVDAALKELKDDAQKRKEGYREASLRIHGHVCARCAREFSLSNLHLLTVHHKDSDHDNNPPDGSNWENLCAYCHEAEHSRELLGDYLEGSQKSRDVAPKVYGTGDDKLGTLGDLLLKFKKKG